MPDAPSPRPTAEILSQGDEVVTGQIADTNAAWLSERLTDLGFDVVRHTCVSDRLEDIVALMREIAARSDVCIGTGGLGPTDDDLTTRAIEAAFARPLAFDERSMARIESMYARFQRKMPEVNRRQAWVPEGAMVLDNDWGTAPGLAVDQRGIGDGRCWFAFVAGVPREMKPLFEHRILPVLVERFALRPGRLVTLRTCGVGESDLQQRIGPWTDPRAALGYRTKLPENFVKLRFTPDVPEAEVRELVDDVAKRIGSPVFAIEGLADEGGDLPTVIARALVARGETLATAESCTGGLVASQCTAVPGASRWFLEGTVTYSNAAKTRLLGVDAAVIERVGAVSADVAHAMAAGARRVSGATYGIAITGIAGPDGGTPDKPVGTVHIALATPTDVHHRLVRFGGDRTRIQALAAASALDLLRRFLHDVL